MSKAKEVSPAKSDRSEDLVEGMTFGECAKQFVVSDNRREVQSVEFGCVQCTQVMP